MINIFKGGSTEQKKKITFIAIYATIAVIVCLLAALLITQIVANKNTPDPSGEGDVGSPTESFTEEGVTAAQLHSGSLVLVNSEYKWSIEDDPSMVLISEKYPNIPCVIAYPATYKAEPTALKAFNQLMIDAYKNISDAKIEVNAAYRTFADQVELSSTPAGESEFHTGMAFRLVHSSENEKSVAINNSSLGDKYQWIYDHAHEYGFIVRYPENKAAITGQDGISHIFRYVGVAHATYMKANDLCLEEYLELLRTTYSYENPLAIKGADGKSYQVYYTAENENGNIMVPTRYGYEISGDNMNGYIVTINKSVKSTIKEATTTAPATTE